MIGLPGVLGKGKQQHTVKTISAFFRHTYILILIHHAFPVNGNRRSCRETVRTTVDHPIIGVKLQKSIGDSFQFGFILQGTDYICLRFQINSGILSIAENNGTHDGYHVFIYHIIIRSMYWLKDDLICIYQHRQAFGSKAFRHLKAGKHNFVITVIFLVLCTIGGEQDILRSEGGNIQTVRKGTVIVDPVILDGSGKISIIFSANQPGRCHILGYLEDFIIFGINTADNVLE